MLTKRKTESTLIDRLWAEMQHTENWIDDLLNGVWPRGRGVAVKQLSVLERRVKRIEDVVRNSSISELLSP